MNGIFDASFGYKDYLSNTREKKLKEISVNLTTLGWHNMKADVVLAKVLCLLEDESILAKYPHGRANITDGRNIDKYFPFKNFSSWEFIFFPGMSSK